MFTLDPGQGVIEAEAVVDGIAVNRVAETRGRGFCHVENRKHGAARTGNAELGIPVSASAKTDARAEVAAVGAVVADVQMVQDCRADGVVIAKANEVSGELLRSSISRRSRPFWIGRDSVVGAR